jgi:hypothetical protein
MYSGTLIEDLFEAVERAEANARSIEMPEVEPWMVTANDGAGYQSELVEVA